MKPWSKDNPPKNPTHLDDFVPRVYRAEQALLLAGWTYTPGEPAWKSPVAERRIVDAIEIRERDDEIERLKATIVRLAMASGVEARVIEDISARQQAGIAKYGTTVADNPLALNQWLQHAYEEALDMAVYLKRAKEMVEAVWEKEVNES